MIKVWLHKLNILYQTLIKTGQYRRERGAQSLLFNLR